MAAGFMVALLGGMPSGVLAQTIECLEDFSFGRIVSCPAGGAVTVTPSGHYTQSGCVDVLDTPLPARCRVQGESMMVVSLDDVHLSSGQGGALAVGDFRLGADGNGNTMVLTAMDSTISVGATLSVAPHQDAGVYSGKVTMTVHYE